MSRLGWLVLAVSSAALAQTPRELFDEGAALYAKGQYAAAAQKFEASFAARPVPVTKFNIARAWEQAGETLKAIDAWQAWLAMSPTAAERPEAERSIGVLGDKLAKLGVQALTITSLPTGATVSIDGVRAGVTPLTVELPPTRHLVRLDLDGRVPVERQVITQLARPVVEPFELAALEPATATATGHRVALPVPLPSPSQPRPTDPEFAFAMAERHGAGAHRHRERGRAAPAPEREPQRGVPRAVRRARQPRQRSLLRHRDGNRRVGAVRAGRSRAPEAGHPRREGRQLRGDDRGHSPDDGGDRRPLDRLGFGIGSSGDKALPVGLGLALGIGGGIGAGIAFGSGGTSVTFPGD